MNTSAHVDWPYTGLVFASAVGAGYVFLLLGFLWMAHLISL
jgi:hypothetical protein